MTTKSSSIIALGLLGLGLAIGIFTYVGLSSVANQKRTVAVRGLSEREVEANMVTWPVVYRVIGNDMQEIYSQIEAGNKTVTDYLTQNGLTADDFTVTAPNVIDKQADRYISDRVANRYMATSGIIVTTSKVAVVRQLMQNQGELLKRGVAIMVDNYEYRTIYDYTDLNSIKPEMIADATVKAREAAEKFAEDSGSKVGKIMSATQGQFTIEDRDPYTPFIKHIRVVTTMTYTIE
ncbi:MAG: SIMPL domain-containing protein [Bacteroidaceae bacterium]|nr:SIMPL domain-containing protein [Bacteroidaceae bacterium]